VAVRHEGDASETTSQSFVTSVLLVAAIAFASGAFTAESKSGAADAEFMKMMDTDKDGFLSNDELAAGHARMMKQASR